MMTPEQRDKRRKERQQETLLLREVERSRKAQRDAEAARALHKQLEEPVMDYCGSYEPVGSTTMHDTGGGTRVIRDPRGLGG